MAEAEDLKSLQCRFDPDRGYKGDNMNIFVVNTDPEKAARELCDKHVPKMTLESVQMLVSALRRHGATDNDVPLTSKGTPHKGGYSNHPSTVWAGESLDNFNWLLDHAVALADEYTYRFGKEHACERQLYHVDEMKSFIPKGKLTDIALCVGEKLQNKYGFTHAPIDTATEVYIEFYLEDKASFAKWDKGRSAPNWWSS